MSTLDDIAREAGVSGATVSNVLRGRGSVSTATAARVRDIATRLGYRPNLVARALAERRAPTIALLFSNIVNPFYAQFAFEAERAARRRERFLLVCNAAQANGSLDTAYLDQVAGTLSDGLIVLCSDLEQDDLASVLPPGVPAVLSTWEDAGQYPLLPHVGVDFRAAGRMAAEHLISLGHTEIGIIAGLQGTRMVHQARLSGALAALRENGIEMPARRITAAEDSIGGGRQSAGRMLDLDASVTAILATNDLLAIGALQATAERRLAVPDRISVVGITDIWMAAEMRPALTTVDIAIPRLAAQSIDLLLDLVEDRPDQRRSAGLIAPVLVRRASTAPP